MGSGIDGGAPKYFTSLCHESAPSSSLLPQFRIHAVVFASEQASIRQYVTRENNQINAAAHGISAGRREERRRRAPHCPLAPFPVESRPLPTEEAVSIAGETENNWNNIFPHCTSPVLLHLLRYVAALFSAGLNWDAWKSETTRGYERRGNNGRRRE